MKALSDCIDDYVNKGFGSMNKNDFEVWIFGQLISMGKYAGKTNYELSLALRIPETKVKRLRYESALKTAVSTEDYKLQVQKLLQNAQLRSDDKKILFQVEDVMLKLYISSLLKKEGRMIDNSFNPEVLVLHLADYEYLVKAVYDDEEVNDLIKKAQEITKEKRVTWDKIMEWVISGAVSGAAGALVNSVVDLTPMGMIKLIKQGFKK